MIFWKFLILASTVLRSMIMLRIQGRMTFVWLMKSILRFFLEKLVKLRCKISFQNLFTDQVRTEEFSKPLFTITIRGNHPWPRKMLCLSSFEGTDKVQSPLVIVDSFVVRDLSTIENNPLLQVLCVKLKVKNFNEN